MRSFFLAFSICVFVLTTEAQTNFGIKEVSMSSVQQKCGECMSVMQNLPPEVSYGFYLEGRKIYFMMTDKRYFDLIFKKGMDGIAVDIITKNAKEGIISFAEGDEQRMMLMGLKRFTKYVNMPNVIALRIQIADRLKDENRYCF